MSMFEYFQVILQKVSFDPQLFRVEYRKAAASLIAEDMRKLHAWCLETFGNKYIQQARLSFT